MKRLLILASVFVAGCHSHPSANSINWTDLQTDIALRHRYEQYSCANRSLHGYSKDSWTRSAPAHHQHHEPDRVAAASVRQATDSAEGRQALDQVRELSAKIDVLEDALKTNAGAANQNQTLIVEQIKSLKAELARVKSANGAASTQGPPPPPTNNVSGIRFGTN